MCRVSLDNTKILMDWSKDKNPLENMTTKMTKLIYKLYSLFNIEIRIS